MSFPKYDRYKESGVEWLGEVPEHWNIDRLKHNLRLLTEKTERRENPVALENIQSWTGFFIPTDTAFEGEGVAFECGDILFGKLRPYLAKAHLAKSPGEAVGDFHIMRPTNDLLGQYALYQILNREFIAIVDGSTFGAKMPRVSWDFMANIAMLIPPLPEQRSIATFLDRETAKIDELITEQQRLIDLLKEKRQAVISHAVTKGLNPDAPMKETAIEWLREVPEEWEVRALRTLSTVVRGASPRPAGDPRFFGGDTIPWVTVAEITKDNLSNLSETEEFLTEEGAQSSRRFRGGTLLYSNSGATLGVPKILQMDACANDGVVGFENLSGEINILFLYYFLSSITESIREKVKQGSGQPNLNTDIVKAIRLALPPVNEQQCIVEHIEKVLKEFEVLVEEAQHAIALLQERRTALISAAVTGKIDVRQAC
jgi:type I restriction enzyme, S subunit